MEHRITKETLTHYGNPRSYGLPLFTRFTYVYNSLLVHVYQCLPIITSVYRIYSCWPIFSLFSCVYLRLLVFTYVYTCLPMFTTHYSCLAKFTTFYSCLFAYLY